MQLSEKEMEMFKRLGIREWQSPWVTEEQVRQIVREELERARLLVLQGSSDEQC